MGRDGKKKKKNTGKGETSPRGAPTWSAAGGGRAQPARAAHSGYASPSDSSYDATAPSRRYSRATWSSASPLGVAAALVVAVGSGSGRTAACGANTGTGASRRPGGRRRERGDWRQETKQKKKKQAEREWQGTGMGRGAGGGRGK